MFFLNFNLLTSYSYKKVTEELKLINYIWEEFKVYNLFKFKYFTDSLLKQSSNFIINFLFLFRFREEIIIIIIINFCIKDSVFLFFFFINWLLIQFNCSQSVQLNCNWFACFLLSILLNVKKKFTIFNEMKVVAKKTLNKAAKKIITV